MTRKTDDLTTSARNEAEIATANAKTSLSGWRNIAGMSVGAAVFVDLLFVMGASLAYTHDILALAVPLAAIGGVGLVEKTARRVR